MVAPTLANSCGQDVVPQIQEGAHNASETRRVTKSRNGPDIDNVKSPAGLAYFHWVNVSTAVTYTSERTTFPCGGLFLS